jgi:hypothetical protein
MTERDELALTLRQEFSGWMGPAVSYDVADVILAAGYRKPRTITTVDGLEDLPKGAVIRSGSVEIWRKFSHKWDNLSETGDLVYPPWHITLPATVLFDEPEATK